MGEVKEKIRLRNSALANAAELGLIQKSWIPELEVDVLVDTDVVMCLLPQDMVEELRLAIGEPRLVTYADERKEELKTGLGLEVRIGKRRMVTDCLVGPPRCEPLLGQTVLAELDL